MSFSAYRISQLANGALAIKSGNANSGFTLGGADGGGRDRWHP